MVDSELGEPQEYNTKGLPSPSSVPLHFMMTNEEIWQGAVQAKERTFSEGRTSEGDLELLDFLVPIDLGKRLLKM